MYAGKERRDESLTKVELALRRSVDKAAAQVASAADAVATKTDEQLAKDVLLALCANLGQHKRAPHASALFRALHRHVVVVVGAAGARRCLPPSALLDSNNISVLLRADGPQ